jgi:hypothetical protein
MNDQLFPLGIRADSGDRYGGATEEALDAVIASKGLDPQVGNDALQGKAGSHLGVNIDTDPDDLSMAGWAVIWGASVTPEIRKAMEPLLKKRRADTGNDKRLFKEFEGVSPSETATAWLARQGEDGISMADPVNPLNGVPYYVLIVASPEDIPFEFQYGLDLNWAVGRIWFSRNRDFERYAESVVAYESATRVSTTRQAVIFSPRNGEDEAMALACERFAKPLVDGTSTTLPIGVLKRFKLDSYKVSSLIGAPATRDAVERIIQGKSDGGPPALVLTASHGLEYFSGDPHQEKRQGALLCDDYQGRGVPKRGDFLAAEDVSTDAKVHGQIQIMFSCYGLGWPAKDNFARMLLKVPSVAPSPSIAALPQRLLSHENGGQLAMIGHIDRAWSSSYSSPRGGSSIEPFRSLMNQLMAGKRVGLATEDLNKRWAVLYAEMFHEIKNVDEFSDRKKLRTQWISRDDARNYIVIGDPAVRLREELMSAVA